MAKTYAENLRRLLRLGYAMSDANSFAKEITDAQKRTEKKKLMEELNSDLRDCGLDEYVIEGKMFEEWLNG